MAAVAGSRGRILLERSNSQSIQRSVLERLLLGSLTPQAAATILFANASLREIGVDTNMVCNLACSYCYLSDRIDSKGTLALDALRNVLIRLSHKGTKLFAFIGKEPLMDDRALALIHALSNAPHASAYRTGLVTNGTLVEKNIRRLVDANPAYIDISIDGLNDRTNSLRRRSNLSRIKGGIAAIVDSRLKSRFATATVLTTTSIDRYPEFVGTMLDSGVETCFASPVLRFAMSNEVSDLALNLDRILELADDLAAITQRYGDSRQVVLDMPYRYTWMLVRQVFGVREVIEDPHEAMYVRHRDSNVLFKLNPFSFSFWRAARITHDGRVLLNMDLAAHEGYMRASVALDVIAEEFATVCQPKAISFLTEFIRNHMNVDAGSTLFERDLAKQFRAEIV